MIKHTQAKLRPATTAAGNYAFYRAVAATGHQPMSLGLRTACIAHQQQNSCDNLLPGHWLPNGQHDKKQSSWRSRRQKLQRTPVKVADFTWRP